MGAGEAGLGEVEGAETLSYARYSLENDGRVNPNPHKLAFFCQIVLLYYFENLQSTGSAVSMSRGSGVQMKRTRDFFQVWRIGTIAACLSLIRRGCFMEGFVKAPHYDGIKLRIHRLDPCDKRPHNFDGRDLPLRDLGGDFASGPVNRAIGTGLVHKLPLDFFQPRQLFFQPGNA